MLDDLLSPTLNRTLATLAVLLCAGLLLWTGARLTWLLLDPGISDTDTSLLTPGTTSGPTLSTRVSLANLNLFGSRPGGAQVNQGPPPETSLNLELKGTLASNDPERGMAIIATGQTGEKMFRVGDELPGGATVVEVHAAHVVLERAGVRETLRLPEQRAQTRVANRPGNTATVPPGAAALRGSNVDWQSAARQYGVDPAQIARNVNALPYRENGEVVGYRLQAGRSSALLQQFGLRPSDIIIAVNGVSLDDPSRLTALMTEVQSSGQANVTVRRDGRDMDLNINLGNR